MVDITEKIVLTISKGPQTVTQEMPNVVGMGLKDALYILESRGLKVSFSGKGMVRSQSIRAGEKISAGKHVTITLK